MKQPPIKKPKLSLRHYGLWEMFDDNGNLTGTQTWENGELIDRSGDAIPSPNIPPPE